jgi:resuscitation-promoting factor RpfA
MIPFRVVAVLLVSDIGLVRQFWPSWPALAQDARAPHRWATSVGADRVILVLGEAAVWLAAVWLGIGLLAALCAALPGAAGELAGWLARQALPAALYRLCVGTVGVSVLVGPIAAGTAVVAADRAPAFAEVATVADPPPPAWPTGAPVPPPAWPQGTNAPAMRPAAPVPPADPGPPAGQASNAAPAGTAVTVRPGDSLWLIAARRLGAGATPDQIGVAWREWYAANRALIGADPNLIRPGQVLLDPGRGASAPSIEEAG